ncbi:MAG: ATP-dependent DNA helicase RecG [Brevinemataceae bacterium]
MKIPELQIPLDGFLSERQIFLLSKLDIYTIEDLLCYFPFRYEDRSKISTLADAVLRQEPSVVRVVVVKHDIFFWNKKRCIKVIIKDQSAAAELVGFNIKALDKMMPIGEEFFIYGKVEFRFNKIQISGFEIDPINKFGNENASVGKIYPIYRVTEGLKTKEFHKIILKAYQKYHTMISDPIPKYFLSGRQLVSKQDAVKELHFPDSMDAIEKARLRGAYEEFLITRIALEDKRSQETKLLKPHSYPNMEILTTLETILPFSMTNAQKRVIKEIVSDLSASYPMHRLVQGDVGSGKTTVALASMLFAASNNLQAAFLAPTEVLAFQHYNKIKHITEELGISCRLLTGSISGKERALILTDLAEGRLSLIIGTHALFQEDVVYHNLSLCVIDEQHKFGVEQRGTMIKKGTNPDILVMTATPIPRTITMALYGDLNISIIDELPAGRQTIETAHVQKHNYPHMLSRLKTELDSGRQIFIVCPLIEESENLENVESVEQIYKEFQIYFPNYRFNIIHGRISQQEKDLIMKQFSDKEFEILIATTVIEVGIDIPNATVMVIKNSERFGLAQLHQLRGRVGRGNHKSYCFAVNHGNIKDQRLEVFCSTSDGFKIAEEDLKIRGPGEILGLKQTGSPIFKLADFAKDQKILQTAVNDAQQIFSKDPDLQIPSHALLKQFITQKKSFKIFSG